MKPRSVFRWSVAGIALALLIGMLFAGCTLKPSDKWDLPPMKPTPTPAATPTPEAKPDLDIPHGPDWQGPRAGLPTLTAVVNDVLASIEWKDDKGRPFTCEVNSRCVVAPGSDKVGKDPGWANYDAAQMRFVEGMRRRGLRAGVHVPGHTDETCVYPGDTGPGLPALECEAFKVASDGGDIVLAWAADPREPCYGGKDEHGFPQWQGCRGVGGGSFRGFWRYGEGQPIRKVEP